MKPELNRTAFNNACKHRMLPATLKRISLQLVLVTAITINVRAQDPVLPSTNLGNANVFDGVAGKPGFAYQNFVQVFRTHSYYDQDGRKSPSDLKVNLLVQMNQLLYMSQVKILGGNLSFMVLVPIVQISSTSASGPAPTANPSVLGDPVLGAAVQWSDKKLFGKTLSHRAEVDLRVPAGSYSKRYNINPSAHLWDYQAYYSFTMMLNKKFSISNRHQFNYSSHIIDAKDKPGAFYNGNYSIDYAVSPSVRIAAVAYFLQQFNEDSYDGNNNYYRDQYAIHDTKERVLGLGPGITYSTPHGVFFEAKTFFETAAKNRSAGVRPTLRIAIPLSK
jgi:hypothetical protein